MKFLTVFLLVFSIVAGFLVGNYLIDDTETATKKQLEKVRQNLNNRIDSVDSELDTIKKNQRITHRKIDSLAFEIDVIQSKQDITHLEIDSLKRGLIDIRETQDNLQRGQEIIYNEVKKKEDKSFFEKMLE